MEAIRDRGWADRMDDLSTKIDELALRMDNGFNRVDADIRAMRDETKVEFAAVRGEIDKRFDNVAQEFEKVDKRFDNVDRRLERFDQRFERIDERFESLYRMMFQFSGALAIALIGALTAVIAQL